MNDFRNIKIIGFDLDQTLYPKSPEIDEAIQYYLYEKIAELKQVNLEEAKKLFDDLYKKGKGLSGRRTLIAIGFGEEEAHNGVQEALENAPIAKFLKPNKKVLNLLKKLKIKYESIDLITGSNKNNSNTKLERLGIPKEIFSRIITENDASKSDLSAFHLWLSYYPDCKPENFLYIGDRISSDYEKPKELGIKSILVNIEKPDPSIECLQLNNLLDIEEYLL